MMPSQPLRDLSTNAVDLSRAAKASIAVAAPSWQPVRSSSPGADTRNADRPSYVTEYASEVIEHLLEREMTLERDSDYLSRQQDVTERMRVILVDWLVDVHLKFRLHPETFFLAVDYVDRYLMIAKGERATLQLVGVCAVLLAAKHEEIWPPEVRECIYISANTYAREQILETERDIATALKFRLCTPTPYPFSSRILDCVEASTDERHITAWCLDVAALDYACLRFRPSRVGFAAVLIAALVSQNSDRVARSQPPIAAPLVPGTADLAALWTRTHQHYSGVTSSADLAEVIDCARGILVCWSAINAPTSRYQAVKRKFTSERFGEVATRYALPLAV